MYILREENLSFDNNDSIKELKISIIYAHLYPKIHVNAETLIAGRMISSGTNC